MIHATSVMPSQENSYTMFVSIDQHLQSCDYKFWPDLYQLRLRYTVPSLCNSHPWDSIKVVVIER